MPFTIYRSRRPPCIVYPARDENGLQKVFAKSDKNSIKKYLYDVYKANKYLNKGSYHIAFIWTLENVPMSDIWIMNMKNFSKSGPLASCYTFKNLELTKDSGIASGDSLIVLGKEEEMRRMMNRTIRQYTDRTKNLPNIPAQLLYTKDYYVE